MIPRSLSAQLVKAAAILSICLSARLLAAPEGVVYLAVGNNYGGVSPLQDGDGGAFTAVLATTSNNGLSFTPTGVPAGYASSALYTLPLPPATQGSGYSAPGGDGSTPAHGGTDTGDAAFVGDPGFETFCIENNVDFYVGNYYNYTEGLAVQQTGYAGLNQNGHAITALTAGAAWLYEQYAEGLLKGSLAVNSKTNAGYFQEALWFLQGQPSDGNVGTFNPSTNPYYLDLLGHMTLTAAQTDLTGNWDSTYNVQVLELTGPPGSPNGNGGIAQDQLIYTGPRVPDTGATVTLFAAGLAVLAGWRRRFGRAF